MVNGPVALPILAPIFQVRRSMWVTGDDYEHMSIFAHGERERERGDERERELIDGDKKRTFSFLCTLSSSLFSTFLSLSLWVSLSLSLSPPLFLSLCRRY